MPCSHTGGHLARRAEGYCIRGDDGVRRRRPPPLLPATALGPCFTLVPRECLGAGIRLLSKGGRAECLLASPGRAAADAAWATTQPCFQPPAKPAHDFGSYPALLFASCFHEKFAAAVRDDGGAVRWPARSHAVAVHRLLGHGHRVALPARPGQQPTAESGERACPFLERVRGPVLAIGE